jgi:hypothetical protein
MKEESVLSIQEAFGDLKDPRSRTSLHNLQGLCQVEQEALGFLI